MCFWDPSLPLCTPNPHHGSAPGPVIYPDPPGGGGYKRSYHGGVYVIVMEGVKNVVKY